MAYLGIDLGTSGLRALLIDDEGRPTGAAERHYSVSHPHSGWSEQNPSDWISALEAAIEEMRGTYPAFADIKGIGVAGHMHGATLLDVASNVLRPCILWNDTRSHAEAARLDAIDHVRALSGNIVFPGFTAPNLEWVRSNEPAIFDQVAKVLVPAAYLNFYLTGDCVADMSDSAGTSWLDVGKRDWSDRLLDVSHMRRERRDWWKGQRRPASCVPISSQNGDCPGPSRLPVVRATMLHRHAAWVPSHLATHFCR